MKKTICAIVAICLLTAAVNLLASCDYTVEVKDAPGNSTTSDANQAVDNRESETISTEEIHGVAYRGSGEHGKLQEYFDKYIAFWSDTEMFSENFGMDNYLAHWDVTELFVQSYGMSHAEEDFGDTNWFDYLTTQVGSAYKDSQRVNIQIGAYKVTYPAELVEGEVQKYFLLSTEQLRAATIANNPYGYDPQTNRYVTYYGTTGSSLLLTGARLTNNILELDVESRDWSAGRPDGTLHLAFTLTIRMDPDGS